MPHKKKAAPPRNSDYRYAVPMVSKVLLVLDALQNERGPQKLEEIHRKTGIVSATLYRILKTLVLRGYAIETRKHTFVKAMVSHTRKIQLGFATSNQHCSTPSGLLDELRELAGTWGVDLVVLDNEDAKESAIRNVNEFIRAQVEVVFESFVHPEFSPVVGDMLRAVGKPTVVIENSLPDATYFGMDNYRAGFDAGERLAQFAERTWSGEADCFVGVCSDAIDSTERRIQGAFARIRSGVRLRTQRECQIIGPDGDLGGIEDCLRAFVSRHGHRAKILILAADEAAQAKTVSTIRRLQRDATTAIAGFRTGANVEWWEPDAHNLVVASVYCESRSYARDLLQVGLALRAGNPVPSYNYAKHIVVGHVSHPRVMLQSSSSTQEDAEFARICASCA